VVLARGCLRASGIKSVCRRETIRIASQWDQLTTTMTESDAAAKAPAYSISSIRSVQGAWIEAWTVQNDYRAKEFRSSTKGKPGLAVGRNLKQTPEDCTSQFSSRGAFSLHR